MLQVGDLVGVTLSTLQAGTSVSLGGGLLGALTNSLGITQPNEPLEIAMVSACLLSGLGNLSCGKSKQDVQVRVLKT